MKQRSYTDKVDSDIESLKGKVGFLTYAVLAEAVSIIVISAFLLSQHF